MIPEACLQIRPANLPDEAGKFLHRFRQERQIFSAIGPVMFQRCVVKLIRNGAPFFRIFFAGKGIAGVQFKFPVIAGVREFRNAGAAVTVFCVGVDVSYRASEQTDLSISAASIR